MSQITKNRHTLENIFYEGTVLTESNFADLIDAISNLKADGLHRSINGSLRIEAEGTANAKNAIALFKDFSAPADWVISLAQPVGQDGFSIVEPNGRSWVFIDELSGKCAIGAVELGNQLTVQGGLGATSIEIGNAVSIHAARVRFGQQTPFQYLEYQGTGPSATISTSLDSAAWIVLVGGFDTSASGAISPGRVKLWPFVGQDNKWRVSCELQEAQAITWKVTLIAIHRNFVYLPVGGDLPLSPPAPPALQSVTAGTLEATVHFDPPTFQDGVRITGYTATAEPGRHQVDGNANAEHLTITGLDHRQYNFTVVANSTAGPSNPSNSMPATPRPDATAPGKPTINSVTAGDSQVTIDFTPPSDNGSAITNYSTDVDPPAGHQAQWQTGDTHVVVNGLTNGQAYTFRLVAHNGVGPSQPSDPSHSAVPAGLPLAPTINSVTPGDSQATIDFTPSSDNGSAITNYTTDVDPPAGHQAQWHTSDTHVVVNGLTNNQAYTFRLVAHNGVGPSQPSNFKSATPESPIVLPGRPTHVEVHPAQYSLPPAVADFDAASPGSAAIDHYIGKGYTSSTGGQKIAQGQVSATAGDNTGTMTIEGGYRFHTLYWFDVYAVDVNGRAGQPSTPRSGPIRFIPVDE